MATLELSRRSSSETASVKLDHLFVNNVRFWAMTAIVAVHCLQTWGTVEWNGSRDLQAGLLQLFKFGTIGFYFISGYLLGERLEQGPAKNYLFRRTRSTAVPWGLWASLFTVLVFSDVLLRERHIPSLLEAASSLGSSLWNVLFASTYWFIPNFLLSLTILLLFRRFLRDWRFGCILLLASLFYGANVYGQWIPTGHTVALFGFVFYQWLGVWVSSHSKLVFSRLAQLNAGVVAGLILVAGVLSYAEAMHLLRTSSGQDPFNTLRISNQLYSLAVLVGLLKLKRATWPVFVDVRSHTFGLYLIHGISQLVWMRLVQIAGTVAVGVPFWILSDPHAVAWRNPAMSLLIWGAMFAAVYSSSLALSIYLVNRSKYGWVVGQRRQQSQRVAASVSTTAAAHASMPVEAG